MTWGLNLENSGSSFSGNLASKAAVGDRDYNDVIENAKRLGLDTNELANRLQKKAQEDMRFQQGVAMENTSFSRGLGADKMRQETYNKMAENEQKNRFDASKSLMDAYGQARQTNANLMAQTLRF
jgi:hypothetical protein